MAESLIKIKNISHGFKVEQSEVNVLSDISFEIKNNSFNVIYGPSGSGKSTLLNIIAGLLEPSKGSVEFNTKNIYKYKPSELAYFRAKEVGFIFQENFWVKSLNVIDNVSLPLAMLGIDRIGAHKIAFDELKRVGMESYANKKPKVLSVGEQQRIAIARALTNKPSLIVADEPTGNLDSNNGDKMVRLLKECQEKLGCTIILVTHNLEYLPLADHLLYMEDGHIKDMSNESAKKITDTLMKDLRERIYKLINVDKMGIKHGSKK